MEKHAAFCLKNVGQKEVEKLVIWHLFFSFLKKLVNFTCFLGLVWLMASAGLQHQNKKKNNENYA